MLESLKIPVSTAYWWIHTLPRGNGFAVEFHNNGATLTRERFEEMVAWIRAEFDSLDKAAQQMKFVN